MKWITLLLFVWAFSSGTSYAETKVEVLGGGITYHIMDDGSAQSYTRKLSLDGRLIFNQMGGLGIVSEDNDVYQSLYFFGGNNSVGKPLQGILSKDGIKIDQWYLGLALGGYVQDDNEFRDAGVQPFRLTEIGSTGIVPIVGLAIDYKWDISNRYYLKLNNIISPNITNTSMALGVNL